MADIATVIVNVHAAAASAAETPAREGNRPAQRPVVRVYRKCCGASEGPLLALREGATAPVELPTEPAKALAAIAALLNAPLQGAPMSPRTIDRETRQAYPDNGGRRGGPGLTRNDVEF